MPFIILLHELHYRITDLPVALLLLWLLLLMALKKAAALVSRVLLKIQNMMNCGQSTVTQQARAVRVLSAAIPPHECDGLQHEGRTV